MGGIQDTWGETERTPDGTFSTELTYTAGVDTPPPVSVAVAVEQKVESNSTDETTGASTRIVVFGDSDFAVNARPPRSQSRPLFGHNQLAHISGGPHCDSSPRFTKTGAASDAYPRCPTRPNNICFSDTRNRLYRWADRLVATS